MSSKTSLHCLYLIGAAALLMLFLTPARYRALAAAVAVTFANPRWIPYNPSYLVVGSLDQPAGIDEAEDEPEGATSRAT